MISGLKKVSEVIIVVHIVIVVDHDHRVDIEAVHVHQVI